MKIITKQQASTKINSSSCSVTEYPLNHSKIDFAIATINGRYPDERRVVNIECDELAYVVEGEGKIVINHQEYNLVAGDVLLIEAGEKYYWQGSLKLFLSCRPAWHNQQHQMVY